MRQGGEVERTRGWRRGWSSTVELDICMARARGEQIISANFKGEGGSGREGIIYNSVSLIHPTWHFEPPIDLLPIHLIWSHVDYFKFLKLIPVSNQLQNVTLRLHIIWKLLFGWMGGTLNTSHSLRKWEGGSSRKLIWALIMGWSDLQRLLFKLGWCFIALNLVNNPYLVTFLIKIPIFEWYICDLVWLQEWMLKFAYVFKRLNCMHWTWFFTRVTSRVEPKWEGINKYMWAVISWEWSGSHFIWISVWEGGMR